MTDDPQTPLARLTEDEADYWRRRAAEEFARAQAATIPAVAHVHCVLSSAYLTRAAAILAAIAPDEPDPETAPCAARSMNQDNS